MAAKPPPSPELLALLPFFFVAMWVLVSFIISQAGWRQFAEWHPASLLPQGTSYNVPFVRFGFWGRYSNAVRVVFTDAGIYFHVLFLFRPFHPPFLIPWNSVRQIDRKEGAFGARFWLEVEDPAGRIQMCLPGKVEKELSPYLKLP